MSGRLTLTFDNGPRPGVTERVLEVLAAHSLTATFFMVGEKAANPAAGELVEAVAAAGHRIGNHTYSHGRPLGADDDPRRPVAEIDDAERVLGNVLGEPPLFRPNGGGRRGPHLLNAAAVEHLVAHRYTVVTWNCVPRDFEPPGDAWVERALAGIESRGHTVLVLHDHIPTMVQHLPAFIERAAELGVEYADTFPRECVPIEAGEVMWPLEGVVAIGTEARST
jgi:peptidoglycan/xylan/chitin deacetylase (PgdA/CDA1 family)